MNIAIVDDDAQVRTEVQQGVRDYLSDQQPALLPIVSFQEFPSAEDFLAQFEPGMFSMIFLDIYMKETTGMDAAKSLRTTGDTTPIVFLTTSTEHLLAGYAVFAAGYLLKPLAASQDAFVQVLDHCLPLVLANLQHLDIVVEHVDVQIPFRNIIYLECNNVRTVVLHLTDRTISTTSPYVDCREQLLMDSRFCECYHRVIINLESITRMDEESFTMSDGGVVPISRRKKNEVRYRYMHHLINM